MDLNKSLIIRASASTPLTVKHSHVGYMLEEGSNTTTHTRMLRMGMQGSKEGNPGITQDLARVFTPLTSLAGPNRTTALHKDAVTV